MSPRRATPRARTRRRRLTLYTQGQGIFDDRRQVAAFLGLPEEEVHVVLVPNGGAFGGKEDMSVQAQTALLARVTGRPVRLVLSREESMRLHPKRHPIRMRYRVGCDAEGRLTAVEARMIGDSGAYASVGGKVLERAAGHAAGPYRCANLDVEALRRLHEQPALRRDARLRREPGPLRDRGRSRHAGREGRARPAGRSAGGTRSRWATTGPAGRSSPPPSASRRRSSP